MTTEPGKEESRENQGVSEEKHGQNWRGREGKGFGWCVQAEPRAQKWEQERSTLSEFLSPPVLDAGDVHPEVAPGERSGQDRQHCLPAALQVSASHPPESRAPVPSVSPPEWGQSRESHFPSATLEFTAQEITSDNKSTLCCVSGCAWALWSTGQRIVTFGEGSM